MTQTSPISLRVRHFRRRHHWSRVECLEVAAQLRVTAPRSTFSVNCGAGTFSDQADASMLNRAIDHPFSLLRKSSICSNVLPKSLALGSPKTTAPVNASTSWYVPKLVACRSLSLALCSLKPRLKAIWRIFCSLKLAIVSWLAPSRLLIVGAWIGFSQARASIHIGGGHARLFSLDAVEVHSDFHIAAVVKVRS